MSKSEITLEKVQLELLALNAERALIEREEQELLLALESAESVMKKISYDIHELRAAYSLIDLQIYQLKEAAQDG